MVEKNVRSKENLNSVHLHSLMTKSMTLPHKLGKTIIINLCNIQHNIYLNEKQ